MFWPTQYWGFVTVIALGLGIVWVNRTAFRRMRQLGDL
jgi:hypothetical protein